MADISKITLPNGTTVNIKDADARADIEDLQTAIAGGITFEGETTTELEDNSTIASVTINGELVTAVKGMLVVNGGKEFVYDGAKWIELGDLSLIGALGWKNSATGSYTPAGSVSQPTFSGSELTSTGVFTPNGSVTFNTSSTTSSGAISYISEIGTKSFSGSAATIRPKVTAEGTVSAPVISIGTAGTTTTVNSITGVGTLPELTMSVANETLTIAFDQGTLPTKGANTVVKTGDATYTASAPTFTGTEVEGSATYTPQGSVTVDTTTRYLKGAFSGAEGTVSVTGTPEGTVSKPTFSGTSGTVTVT